MAAELVSDSFKFTDAATPAKGVEAFEAEGKDAALNMLGGFFGVLVRKGIKMWVTKGLTAAEGGSTKQFDVTINKNPVDGTDAEITVTVSLVVADNKVAVCVVG